MATVAKTDYSTENPPESCLECEYHGRTYSPTNGHHTYWYDYCGYISKYFAKLHIFLRREYRSLAKHNEKILSRRTLPYECPFFNMEQAYWDVYGGIQMDYEIFVYECAVHTTEYFGYYVYTLPETVKILMAEIPPEFQLTYLQVKEKDRQWFIEEYSDRTVLLTDQDPSKAPPFDPPPPI